MVLLFWKRIGVYECYLVNVLARDSREEAVPLRESAMSKGCDL